MIPPNDLSNLLDEMTGGIRKHASLCAVLLPRVAPEGSIVAMFAEGLLSENRSRAVHIEWGKKDLVLYDGERSFWFEFKCLWSNGYSECAGGIMKDYDKLLESEGTGAFPAERAVVAIAYSIVKAPTGHEIRETKDSLDSLAKKIEMKMQSREVSAPMLKGSAVEVMDYGCVGRVQLLAWSVDRAPS